MSSVNQNEGMPLRQTCNLGGMNEYAERVERLLVAKGVKDRDMRTELADACGIKYQSVKGWFDGTSKSITAINLAKIAKHWNANLHWLITGEGEMLADSPAQEGASEADYDLVPQYDARFAAGGGYLNGHVEVKGQLAFKKSWISELGLNPSKILVAYLDGLSMYPTIHDGEVVLVNLAEKEPISGKVYAIIRPNGGLSAKRLIKKTIGDGWIIRSDNPDKNQFPDEDATEETLHEAPILGRIRWRGGDGGL